MDGFGVAPPGPANAIHLASTPTIDKLNTDYPHTELFASGEDVGLPKGFMGNSEVGHLNIGAGRIIYQDLTRIDHSIETGEFFENPAINDLFKELIIKDKPLHLMGLLSDGGVHSHNTHLYALLKLARMKGLKKVFIHVFLDGRDVPPKSAAEFIEDLEKEIKSIGVGKVATVSGRYYGMDRDNRWDRIKLAYDAIVYGQGLRAVDAKTAVINSYSQDKGDEFVLPTIVAEEDRSSKIHDGDGIIFFNFRADRARQISKALFKEVFESFDTGPKRPDVRLITFTEYDKDLGAPIAFLPNDPKNTLADVIADNGLTQFHTAETEKYAHVTFFLNGGVEKAKKGEDRLLIPSPQIATYDLQPEMSATQVGQAVCNSIADDKYDVVIANFANPDMVGHSGQIEATISAIETVDRILGEIIDCVSNKGGELLILSDHGNAETMEEKGGPWTAHTKNKVPLWYVSKNGGGLEIGGRLADVAPTLLDILGLDKPIEMTGKSLIEKD